MIPRRTALALAAGFAFSACAPRLQVIGPALRPAAFGKDMLLMPDGADLPFRVWLPWDRPAKGVMVALHGFNDHSGGMSMPGHGLARRGFIVYAYDQRGFGKTPQHGIWPGTEALIADLRIATGLVRERHPDLPIYLLGESMGAAVIMAAMSAPEDLPVAGAILAAPAIWGRQTISAFDWAVLDAAAHALPWITVRPTGVRRVASDNRQALRRLGADPLVIKATRIDAAYGLVELMSQAYAASPALGRWPTLLMFGGHESILDRGAVAQFLASVRPGRTRVAIYPRGYHLLLRDFGQGQVLDDIVAWIDRPQAPLPSGADYQARSN